MTEEFVGRYVNVEGGALYYETIGEGPALVCLPTAGREGRQWHWAAKILARHYNVHIFDLPGHGKSWPVPAAGCHQNIADISDAIWNGVAALGLDHPIIAGCSIGASVALYLGTAHPDRLAGLVAVQGAAYTPAFSESALRMMQHPKVSLPHFNREHSWSLFGNKGASAEIREFFEWSIWELNPTSMASDLHAYSTCDLRGELSQVTCPVLLLRGKLDWLVTHEMVLETKRLLTKAERVAFVEHEGIGHYAPMEAPETIAGSMIEFFKGR